MKYYSTFIFSLFIAFFSFSQANSAYAQYCIPVFSSGCGGDNMNTVQFPDAGIIHLGSGASPSCYGDFTNTPSLQGTMEIGETYSFTINHTGGSQMVRIYIDFNSNQSFEDAGELLFTSPSGANITSGTITIPANVNPGSVRMRLISSWLNLPINSCQGGSNWGETHDYTVQLIQAEPDECNPDLIPPTVNCPSDIIVTLNPGECDRIVNYSVTASDNCPFIQDGPTLQYPASFVAHGGGQAFTLQGNTLPGGVFFNLTNNGTDALIVTGFGIRFGNPAFGVVNAPQTMQIFTAPTYVGNETNAGVWTNVGPAVVNPIPPYFATGTGDLGQAELVNGVNLAPGETRGFHIFGQTACPVFNWAFGGVIPPIVNGPITLTPGSISFGQFGPMFQTGQIGVPNIQVNTQIGGEADIVQTDGLPSGSVFEVGTVTNCFEVEDVAGNVGDCCFDITVNEFPNPTPVMVCNDLVNVSVDQNCEALLNADMILEGGPYGCYDDYELVIETMSGVNVGNPIGSNWIGQTLMVTVIDPVTGNSCWGNIKIEDKIKPDLVCRDLVISCNDEVPLAPAPADFANQAPVQFPESFLAVGGGVAFVLSGNTLPGGVYFDVTNNTPEPFRVTGFGVRFSDPAFGAVNPPQTMQVYTAPTFVGNETNPAAWTNLGPYTIQDIPPYFPTGTGDLAQLELSSAQLIPPGETRGFHIFGATACPVFNYFSQTAPVTNGPFTVTGGPVSFDLLGNLFQAGAASMPNIQVNYQAALDPIDPSDNCGPVTVDFTESVDPGDCDDEFQSVITRNWTATDLSGNQSTCQQTISVERGNLEDYEAPATVVLSCSANFALDQNGNPHPSVTGSPLNDFCDNIVGTYTDTRIEGECGDYKVVRRWTLLDWCTFETVRFNQLIKVVNDEGPVIECPTNQTISTSFNNCEGTFDLLANPPLELSDVCSDNLSYTVGSSAGVVVDEIIFGVRFWTIRNLPVGTHQVTYTANDGCDNFSSCTFDVTVVDNAAPIALCDLETVVSLGSDGNASVHVSAWDDGSYDNCGVLDITARRKGVAPQQTRCGERNDWRASVNFCCDDLANSPIEIEVRVRDVNWQFVPPPATNPNENICWVTVIVEDKLRPVVSCPPDVTVNCAFDLDLNDMDNQFGRISRVQEGEERRTLVIDPVDLAVPKQIPVQTILDGVAIDNCGPLTVNESNVFTLNPQCGNVGVDPNPLFPFRAIQRRFVVTDPQGNSANCQQDIYIRSNTRPFNGNLPWPQGDIRWPENVTLSGCGTDPGDYAPDNLPVAEQNRRPFTRDVACSKPAMSYQDQVFTLVDSACFKILRTWKVIDWCQHNPNTGQGEWTYVQVIYIQDTQAPICNNCQDGQQFIDESSTDCTGFVEIELDLTDCTPDELLVGSWQIDAFSTGTFDLSGNGLSLAMNLPNGEHIIRWTVYDLCSNTAVFEYSFEVIDGKLPTPVCLNGIATVVMPSTGDITIPASFFDVASFDNCTESSDLIFSYSSDVEETTWTWTCEQLDGAQEQTFEVEIWVTDEAGNQDFCVTYILIQDNNGVCPDTAGGTAAISGWIRNENNASVEDVSIQISATNGGLFQELVTGNDGVYMFNVPIGFNYELSGERTDNPLNGVTTYDIALVQRHILGTQYLDSPYKLIAADVNNDGNINVLDIAQLRRLILGTYDEFPNNASWKVIVDEPLAMGVNPPAHQTTLDMGYVIRDMEDNNFVGVKIGDVNASHNVSGAMSSSERSLSEDLRLIASDASYVSGEQVVVAITSDNIRGVFGYQGTINFDAQSLEFAGYESGSITLEDGNFGFHLLSEGMITTSWSEVEAMSGAEGVLFSLVFEARADGQLSESLSIGSERTSAESYNNRGVMGVEMVFEGQQRENNFALYQNTPNPFNGQTVIGFVMPEANEATMTIYDVTGKVVRVISGDYAAGYNEIRLDRNSVGAAGVYYYQLDTENHSATKKMIFMD